MMIMQADRQDFDDVTGHMNLTITFIGLMFLCQQKTSQNKQISVRLHMIKQYAIRSRLCQRQRLNLAQD